MSITITPLRGYLLVEPLPDPPKSDVIAVVSRGEVVQHGRVVRVGEDVTDVEVGDVVAYNGTMAVAIDDQRLLDARVVLALVRD